MNNIELKARYPSLDKAEQMARQVGAEFSGRLQQIDTYFTARRGRLKLRQIQGQTSQLIAYTRPDDKGTRLSDYHIYPVEQAESMKAMLDAVLGTWCVVEKERILYLYDEVRIHLDSVISLGTFIEFEGVLDGDAAESDTQRKVDWLTRQFDISGEEIIAGSYSDLLHNSRAS